jgi:hypothetical protein
MTKPQPTTCPTRSAPALVVRVYVNVAVSLECSNEAPSRSTFPTPCLLHRGYKLTTNG